MNERWLQKWYTRGIGIFFVLVLLSLIADYREFGHRPETWHKIFHVVVGAGILVVGWSNERVWRPFCLVNGGFFAFVGAFGWTFPDFARLEAFNRLDTILHSLVGAAGLLIGFPRGEASARRSPK
jgi:hypothetical protein